MVDFVEEVEEQIRAERYATMFQRGWPWFVAVLAAVVVAWLGVWGYHSWRDRDIAAASITYDRALTTLASGDETGGFTGFDPIAKNGPAAYRTLALMQQGNIRLAGNKAGEAAALYDQAAKAAPSAFLGDLARLKAALALMDTAPYPLLETRLKAIIGDKKPFDLQAREALAMAKLQAGKTTEARNDLNALGLTLGVTPAVRERAQSAIALIDAGQGKAAGDVARLAATLPPPSAATLSALGVAAAPAPAAGAPSQASGGPTE